MEERSLGLRSGLDRFAVAGRSGVPWLLSWNGKMRSVFSFGSVAGGGERRGELQEDHCRGWGGWGAVQSVL
jgi:hypothetical protein